MCDDGPLELIGIPALVRWLQCRKHATTITEYWHEFPVEGSDLMRYGLRRWCGVCRRPLKDRERPEYCFECRQSCKPFVPHRVIDKWREDRENEKRERDKVISELTPPSNMPR
jgi:hypothetical protein